MHKYIFQRRIIFAALIGLLLVTTSARTPTFAQRQNEIREITFEERSSWIGLIGIWCFRFDGGVTLTATDPSKKSGENIVYRGKFDGFDRLKAAISEKKFFELRRNYSNEDIFDDNTAEITVFWNHRSKTVTDYARSGPDNLVELERLFQSAEKEIKWEKSKPH